MKKNKEIKERKSRIRNLCYNNAPELVLTLFSFIVIIVALLVELLFSRSSPVLDYVIRYLLIAGLTLCGINIVTTERRKFFSVSRSILPCFRDCVWINQRTLPAKASGDTIDERKNEVKAEIADIIGSLPTNTVVYCATHKAVVDLISSQRPIKHIETYPYGKKNIYRLKRKVGTEDGTPKKSKATINCVKIVLGSNRRRNTRNN